MKRLFLLFVLLFAAASLHAEATFQYDAPPPWYRPLYFREGAGIGTITILRSGDMTSTVSVGYEWEIYGGASGVGTLTFGPQETSKSFTITLPNDAYFTGGWQGITRIRVPGGEYLGFKDIAVDDDEPMPSLTALPISVPEGNSGTSTATLHFRLSAPIGRDVYTVLYVAGGTATKDVDFVLLPANFTLPALQTEFDVPVTIKGDVESEPDETIEVGVEMVFTTATVTGNILGVGEITILNDDYILSPAMQQIEVGATGSLDLSTSVPPSSAERIDVTSGDPSVVSVPPFVDVPSGATSATIPIVAMSVGTADITLKLPASRGGGMLTSTVSVYTRASLSFDRPSIAMTYGSQTTATLTMAPPPPSPLTLTLKNGNAKVVNVPDSVTVGTDGKGSFPVRAAGTGDAFVSTTLPIEYGSVDGGFFVRVSEATGLAITSLSSKSGPESGGQAVTLIGNEIQGRCSITFGGVPALNTAVAAAGSVATYTPPHAPGAVDVGIRCGTEEFTLAGGYTYTPAPPRIIAVAPATGATGGGTIVIASGENLPRGRCSLWFGAAPATTLTNFETSQMSAIVPPHAAGAVAVTLRCGSDTSTLTNAFVYSGEEPAAEIAALTPSSGAPGDRVLLNGSRFRTTDAIAFGPIAASGMTTSATTHAVTVPEIAAGPVTVTLRDGDGRTITGPAFTVLAPAAPQITSAPAKATVRSEIVVNGAGLRPSLVFAIAGVPLRPVSVLPSYAILRLPESIAPQQTTLALLNASGATLSSRPIEVTTSGVAVESATPLCMTTDGGTLVTIRGSGFEPGAVVTFGIADAAEVTVRDAQTIVARAPASSGVSDATITVTNRSLDSGQLTGFQYRWPDSQCGPMRRRTAGR